MGRTIILPALFAILILSVSIPSVFATHDSGVCPVGTHDPIDPICDPLGGPFDILPGCICDEPNDPGCITLGSAISGIGPGPGGLQCLSGTRVLLWPIVTIQESCQDNSILDTVTNHCVPDLDAICGEGTMSSGLQCISLGMQAVGGMLVEIDALAVLGAAVGVDPLITGLVVITMVGITGQAAWFVHIRKNQKD